MSRWTDKLMRTSSRPVKNEFGGSMVMDPHSGQIVTVAQKKARETLVLDRLDRALQIEVERYKAIVTRRIVEIKQEPLIEPAAFHEKATQLANINNSLASAMLLPGAIGVAVVDLESGMSLGQAGGGSGTLNLDVAAAGNTEVVRAKMRVMQALDLNDEIDDILITLGKQYHIIRPLKGKGSAGLFVYLALDKSKANLALSRHKLNEIAQAMSI